MLRRFRDDMGRDVTIAAAPQRIVSLVPSETETLFALGLGERVVGRTSYCEEPAGLVDEISVVGGTKSIDVDAVCALKPDIVFANQEENSRPPLEALANRGVRLFVSFPQRVADGVALVARIARVCGADRDERVKEIVAAGYRAVKEAEAYAAAATPLDVFVPIWVDPLMTISERTFGSDMLRLCGARNVFADRLRKYPLKADLGLRSPLAADRVAMRDNRYPRITDEELAESSPAAVLLPNEPYEFKDADSDRWQVPSKVISGRDLFWYGARIPGALERLRAVVNQMRG